MTLVFFTYMAGLGILLSETPVGSILIGVGAGYLARKAL